MATEEEKKSDQALTVKEDATSKVPDSGGVGFPANPYGNLRLASSNEKFTQILTEIKSSKTSAVINYGASWCRVCSQILPSLLKTKMEKESMR